jgi:hypothetical protein
VHVATSGDPTVVSGSELILGRFVRLACPWCGADTYAVPGVDAMACASHARAWFGAREPVRPVPGASNSMRMGQPGVNAYPHTPRAATAAALGVVAPVVLVPRRGVLEVDGAPATVVRTVRAEGGAAWYWAALWQEGAQTRPGGVTEEEGGKARRSRVAVPPLDRWLLEETIAVLWDRDDERGFRLWRRRGRGGWVVACTWRRPVGGVLNFRRGNG